MNTGLPTRPTQLSLAGRTGSLNQRVLGNLREFAARKPLGAVGGVVLIFFVFLALIAPLVVPFNPNKTSLTRPYAPISSEHLLGTDELGRDLFSRVLTGARISLFVGFFAPGLGLTVGSIFGVASGYLGGRFDLIGQRVVDIIMAIPSLLLVMVLLSIFGFSLWKVIFAASFLYLVVSSRTLRSTAIGLKERQFIDAARAIGATNLRILFRHIAPNCAAPYLVLFAIYFGQAVLLESTLSFLGLGVRPPTASWGNMLSGAQTYVRVSPQAAIAPGLALSIVVLGINLLGDSLRDVLDPRLRGRR